MRIELNTTVTLPDGGEARIEDVVLDPARNRVSHLVLFEPHERDDARLVPIDRIFEEAGKLRCSAQLDSFPNVESTQFVRISAPVEVEGDWQVGIEEVSALPYYQAEGIDGEGPLWLPEEYETIGITYHRIPKDTVEIRRLSQVLDANGNAIGHVDGFVLDQDDHVTHVVLEQGHLWGRQDVAIPVGAVAATTTDELRLSITSEEIDGLPRLTTRPLWPR